MIEELAQGLAYEQDPTARWNLLTCSLAKLGLDQINYAFLDFTTADRMEARGDPAMSTMRSDWIAYYADQTYDLRDTAVAHVRAGHTRPLLWSANLAPYTDAPEIIHEANDAGLRSGLLVPLAGPVGSVLPAAGIMLGSGMEEAEFRKVLNEHGLALVTAAHLFHAGSVGELIRRRHKVPPLSLRERDCVQMLAQGLRPEAIADRLNLARVTVDLHLKNARRKLGAKTPSECVARAMLYQMITLG